MAEIPGITPKVADFARRVAGIGCTVVMPVLFGDPGAEPTVPYALRSIAPACVSKEFAGLGVQPDGARHRWLRALAADAHERAVARGWARSACASPAASRLGMMLDDRMLAPVLSQPSLPLGLTQKARRGLQLAPEDLARVKERAADGRVRAGPALHRRSVREGGAVRAPPRGVGRRLHRGRDRLVQGQPVGLSRPSAHSVLTEHLVDEPGNPTHDALNQVLDFFRDRLLTAG